ncbi:hypothetical protein ETB97_012948 [Aspergillus alliaceus]|uniref:Uncharacterized protein n=1 Tax=Petromyces alliaceus TaxID=209559 RepID=A0A8H6E7K0_PETAA|nr:hypothetical protein ETB97_012948 [Aspergillus burnettii]
MVDGDPASDIALPWQLTRSAYVVNMLDGFWQAYLPDGKRLDPRLGHHSTWGMVKSMELFLSQGGVVGKAVAALCLATVDLTNNNQWMRQDSLRYYSEALRDMTIALSQPRRDCGMGLVSAIRIFSIYEVRTPHRPNQLALDWRLLIRTKSYFVAVNPEPSSKQSLGWMTHITGEISLFRTNDPSYYATGAAHRLFVDDRLYMISVALHERKPSFLRDEAWKTLPWSVVPKTPRDLILDILVEVPTAFEAADTYQTMASREPITAEVRRRELVQFCLGLHLQLARWHADHLAVVHWASQVTPLWDMDTPTPAPSQPHIAMLHVMTLYWGTSSLIHSILRATLKDDEPRPCNMSPEVSCSKIIVALSNLLHPNIGLFRIHLVTIPLSIVMLQLQDSSLQLNALCHERRLLARCLAHPGCSSISKFLSKLAHLFHFNVRLQTTDLWASEVPPIS